MRSPRRGRYVDIARGMGKESIAEFVTVEPTERLLERLGVGHAQGAHVGAPQPLTALVRG